MGCQSTDVERWLYTADHVFQEHSAEMKGVAIRPLAIEDAEGLLAHWIDIASEAGIYLSYTPISGEGITTA